MDPVYGWGGGWGWGRGADEGARVRGKGEGSVQGSGSGSEWPDLEQYLLERGEAREAHVQHAVRG